MQQLGRVHVHPHHLSAPDEKTLLRRGGAPMEFITADRMVDITGATYTRGNHLPVYEPRNYQSPRLVETLG